jgi:hypothetical protein
MHNDNNNTPGEPFEARRKPQTPEELTQHLSQFTGTEHYYRYWLGLVLTDGVKYLADEAGCYWLLDAIGSYQSQLAKHPDHRMQEMQSWRLTVNADKSAVLTCVADSGEPPVVTQQIEMTDFPLPEIQIWVGIEGDRRIALLPSEY